MCNYVFFRTEELIGHLFLLHVPRGMASGIKPDLIKEPLDHLKKMKCKQGSYEVSPTFGINYKGKNEKEIKIINRESNSDQYLRDLFSDKYLMGLILEVDSNDDDVKSGSVSLSKIGNDYGIENDKMMIEEIEYKELMPTFGMTISEIGEVLKSGDSDSDTLEYEYFSSESSECEMICNSKSDVKKYKCKKCDKYFENNKLRRTHEKLDHLGCFNKCEYCTKQYKTNYARWRHEKLVHGNYKFICGKCGENFKSDTAARKHTKKHDSKVIIHFKK
jgi:hypothetical protein